MERMQGKFARLRASTVQLASRLRLFCWPLISKQEMSNIISDGSVGAEASGFSERKLIEFVHHLHTLLLHAFLAKFLISETT
jgi:hypothetical protein